MGFAKIATVFVRSLWLLRLLRKAEGGASARSLGCGARPSMLQPLDVCLYAQKHNRKVLCVPPETGAAGAAAPSCGHSSGGSVQGGSSFLEQQVVVTADCRRWHHEEEHS